MTLEEVQRLIEDAPDTCPITGLYKCESYIIEDNVVYLTNPAYDAYTLPVYSEEDRAFYHTKYDMDNGFKEENMYLCNVDDLETHENVDEIKRIYGIQ